MSLLQSPYKSIAGCDLPFAHPRYSIPVMDFTSYANKAHANLKHVWYTEKLLFDSVFSYHAVGKALRMCFHINDQPGSVFLWEIHQLYLPKFQLDGAHRNRKSRQVQDQFLFYWIKSQFKWQHRCCWHISVTSLRCWWQIRLRHHQDRNFVTKISELSPTLRHQNHNRRYKLRAIRTYIIVWFVSNLLFPISTVFLCFPLIGFLSSMLGLRSSWISRRAWVECHLSLTKYFQFTMS